GQFLGANLGNLIAKPCHFAYFGVVQRSYANNMINREKVSIFSRLAFNLHPLWACDDRCFLCSSLCWLLSWGLWFICQLMALRASHQLKREDKGHDLTKTMELRLVR